MIYFLGLVFFFVYSFVLFFICNYYVLFGFFLFNVISCFVIRISVRRHIKFILKNLVFIMFITFCNIILSNISTSLLVGIRLFLIVDFTFIISNIYDDDKIRMSFYYLFYPLKIFKVDIESLILIISISLAFIPILSDEARVIKSSLKSKGFDFSFKNLITRPHIYVIAYVNGVFDRVEELERSLIIKAY